MSGLTGVYELVIIGNYQFDRRPIAGQGIFEGIESDAW